MKTIELNNVKYIDKKSYEKLLKSKKVITVKKATFSDIATTNPENTIAVLSSKMLYVIEDEIGKTEKYNGNLDFKNKSLIKEEYPRVIIRDTSFSYEYFLQAVNIAKAFNLNIDYSIRLTQKKDNPCILDFGNLLIVIAPRIQNEETKD